MMAPITRNYRKSIFLATLSVLRRKPVVLALFIATFVTGLPCFFSVVSFKAALSPQEALDRWNKPRCRPVGRLAL